VKLRNLYKIFVGYPEGTIPMHGWKEDIQQILQEIQCERANWIQLGQNRIKGQAVVNAIIPTSGFHKRGNILFIQAPLFLKEGY
jgi:hypothetical protein